MIMIVDIVLTIIKVEIEDEMLTIVQSITRIEDDNRINTMAQTLKHIQWEEIYDTSVIMYGLNHDRTMLIASIMNNIGQINSNIDQGHENVRVETSVIIIGVSRKNHEGLHKDHPIEGKKVVGVDMNIDHGLDITNNDLLMYDNNTIKRMKRRRKGQGQSQHQHDMHVI